MEIQYRIKKIRKIQRKFVFVVMDTDQWRRKGTREEESLPLFSCFH